MKLIHKVISNIKNLRLEILNGQSARDQSICPLDTKGCQMGEFEWVINGLGPKKRITHLDPFKKIYIAHTQPNPVKPNPPIYSIILCM